MKTQRYLLIAIVVMLTALPAGAQYSKVNSVAGCTTFEQTELQYQFQSTSAMLTTDTKLGMSEDGAFTTGISTGKPLSFTGPHRAPDEGAGDGDTPPADPQGPYENPIGDGVWAMLLMAAGYLLYRVRTRKREVTA